MVENTENMEQEETLSVEILEREKRREIWNNMSENERREKLSQDYQKEFNDMDEFLNEFHQLSDFMMAFLKKKYGYLVCDFENFLWMLDGDVYMHRTEDIKDILKESAKLALNEHNSHINQNLENIERKIDVLINQKNIHILEIFLQNLLIKYPQIIEPNLIYLKKEYWLGNTSFRGDILFQDINLNKLNVELKVVVPSFNKFKEQMSNYLNNVGKGERMLYIAPKLTPEQQDFCSKNNIEIKIINLDEIFN
jgi:hypothetical protein